MVTNPSPHYSGEDIQKTATIICSNVIDPKHFSNNLDGMEQVLHMDHGALIHICHKHFDESHDRILGLHQQLMYNLLRRIMNLL